MERISKQKLKSVMIAAGLGTKKLAELTGLTQPLISRFLKNEYSTVRLPTLSKLSKALNVSAQDLISESDSVAD